jgi:glucosamine-6-phosphate deaminase
MKLVEVKNGKELAEVAAKMILEKVRLNPQSVLGLATGGTPIKTYEQLLKMSKNNNVSFHQVKTVNLDEYVGLNRKHPNSYYQYMWEHLFNFIDIQENNINIPNGLVADLDEECVRYESVLDGLGGVDLQLLGIGNNGHIGFNEPGTSFSSTTHIVDLSDSTRKANARYFRSLDDVPTQAITMGIGSIMKSKEILLLVSGMQKASILSQFLTSGVTENLPASVLKNHSSVTVVADEEALKHVNHQDFVFC